MITALASWVFAALFLEIGRWGRRNAPDLAPSSLSPDGREKSERSLRRGAWSVTMIGALFVLLGLVSAVAAGLDAGT